MAGIHFSFNGHGLRRPHHSRPHVIYPTVNIPVTLPAFNQHHHQQHHGTHHGMQPSAPSHHDNEPVQFSWISTTSHGCRSLESKGVQAGHEGHDGSPIYVGRAWHDGDLVPCKIIPRHNVAYIPYNGKEIKVHNFEMYCKSAPILQWLSSSNGNVPSGAVAAGTTKSGETLYVARAHYNGSLTPGKVHRSHGCCYISFGGNEIRITQYEVMCHVYN